MPIWRALPRPWPSSCNKHSNSADATAWICISRRGKFPCSAARLSRGVARAGPGLPICTWSCATRITWRSIPLLHGFAIADTVAPTLQRVAITPHGRNAQVEGGHDPYVLNLRWQPSRGEFVGVRPVQVLGPVSISALMYDRADAAPNKLSSLSRGIAHRRRAGFCRALRAGQIRRYAPDVFGPAVGCF